MHSLGIAAASAVTEAESESILRHILLGRGHITTTLGAPFQRLPRVAVVGTALVPVGMMPFIACIVSTIAVIQLLLGLAGCRNEPRQVQFIRQVVDKGGSAFALNESIHPSIAVFHCIHYFVVLCFCCCIAGRPSKTLLSLCRRAEETPSTSGREIGGRAVAALTRQRKAHQPAIQTRGSNTWTCSTGRHWSSRRIPSQAWSYRSS
jgi:hypothetical protein